MPIIVVGTEKNFTALRPRVFGGKVSSKAAHAVADQVRKANPHADLDKLTPGTVLRIPDSADVRVAGELSLDEATRDALRGLAEHGKSTLGDIAATAERREAEMREDRARALKALDAIDAAKPKPRERGLAKQVKEARAAITGDDELAHQRTTTLKRAQAEWADGLDALAQRLA